MSDPAHGHYRTKQEVDEERKRDPLIVLQQVLREKGLAADADFKALERDVAAIVTASVRFADESPFPEKSVLYDDVTVE
jgi:pyruvate dehydrogenase E1 component alpha subunit